MLHIVDTITDNSLSRQLQIVDGDHLSMHFSITRVMISYFISFMGAYMCTCACEQLRLNNLLGRESFLHNLKWHILMGLSIGGIGIWSMHFLGMSALTLEDQSTHKMIASAFNIAVSVSSLIVVIITTTIGVMIAAKDPMFMKTKGEILEMFLQDTSKLSMSEIRQMKNFRLLKLITTKNLGYLITGGLVAGSGVSVMHFIGMDAMRVHGRIEWNAGLVFFAVMIAIVASTVAFWILFRLLSLFPSKESLRLASSAIMGIAVCGMHYTGMVAAKFIYENRLPKMVESYYMHRDDAFIPVIVAVVAMVVILTVFMMADLRKLTNKYHRQCKSAITPSWKSALSGESVLSRVFTSIRKTKVTSNTQQKETSGSFKSFTSGTVTNTRIHPVDANIPEVSEDAHISSCQSAV